LIFLWKILARKPATLFIPTVKSNLRKTETYIILIGVLSILTFISCNSKAFFHKNDKVLTKACELNNRINDTIIIKGIYSQCMEYSVFKPIKKDSCQENYYINLNFDQTVFPKDLLNKFYQIQGCNGTIKMTLKGILKNESEIGYGHLGSNNTEMIIQKVIDFGELIYK